MSRLVALIALCGLCSPVFSDDGRNCIFDFEAFRAERDYNDKKIDFSRQKLATLQEGGRKYKYITGPIRIKSAIDSSMHVNYIVEQLDNGQVTRGKQGACEFFEDYYRQYLAPISAMHSDFGSPFNICEVKPRTSLNLFPANNTKELTAPSKLSGGRYYFEMTFIQDFGSVGGMSGVFNLIRT